MGIVCLLMDEPAKGGFKMNHAAVVVLLILLGYLIRFRQWAWLIAGYNTSSTKTKDSYDLAALTRAVGNFMFVLSVFALVSGLGQWLDIARLTTAGWIGFALAVLVFLLYANTGNRYKKNSKKP